MYNNQKIEGFDKVFHSAYIKYYSGLYQYASSYLKDPEEAKNAVQDVFVLFWEKQNSIDSSENIKRYLVASLKYLLWNEISKKKRRRFIEEKIYDENIEELDLHLYTLEHTPITILCANEVQEIINITLDTQGEVTKEIFKLSRDDNFSYKEIAEKLGRSQKNIEYHISRALAALREALKHHLNILILIYFYFF